MKTANKKKWITPEIIILDVTNTKNEVTGSTTDGTIIHTVS